MTIKFSSLYKHGTREFLPDVPLAFGEEAEAFFIWTGAAQPTDDPPAHTYAVDEIEVDSETRRNTDGALFVDDVQQPATVAAEQEA